MTVRPNIVFHNDIRCAPEQCKYPAAVKPSEAVDTGDHICINPYHYVLTVEAMNRFVRAVRDDYFQYLSVSVNRIPHYFNRFNKHQNQQQQQHSASQHKKSTPTTTGASHAASAAQTKKSQQTPKASKVSRSSKAKEEKIIDFDDDGVDYIKLWDEKAVGSSEIAGDGPGPSIIPFDVDTMINEINFLDIKKTAIGADMDEEELRYMCDVDDKLKDALKDQVKKLWRCD